VVHHDGPGARGGGLGVLLVPIVLEVALTAWAASSLEGTLWSAEAPRAASVERFTVGTAAP
jgi:hypothetical protein